MNEGNIGVGFAVTTFGKPDKSLTLGLGVARTVNNRNTSHFYNGRFVPETRHEVSHTPVVVFGGTARITTDTRPRAPREFGSAARAPPPAAHN